MTKLLQLYIFTALLAGHQGTAQQLSPFVIAATGGFSSGPAGQVSQTTGELAVTQTLSTAQAILTQGFQQPWILEPNRTQEALDGFRFGVSPNPSDGHLFLYVEYTAHLDLEIRILDITGREILNDRTTHDGPERVFPLDVSQAPPGTYILSILATQPMTYQSQRFFQKLILTK